MKKMLSGRHLDCDDDIIAAVVHFQDANSSNERICLLQGHKCVNAARDYAAK